MALRENVLANIDNGQMFSVEFRRRRPKPGQLPTRRMNGRRGVHKHLKGGEKKFCDVEKGLVTMYDTQAKGYRSFGLAELIEITVDGRTFRFDD